MRKLLTLLIALAAIVGISASSHAQLGMTGVGGGGFGGGAAAYSGPGDVVTTGWVWWFGLRAFSAATAGTKAANICWSTGGSC